MEPRIRSKKEKILRISIALAIVTSLILSIASYYTLSTIDEITNGEDGVTTVTRISDLYGTHGCEDGGFSIQIGADKNGNSSLDNNEVTQIRNICHGSQGPPGPMGNRGYWGTNGTDGLNGSNGSDGLSGKSSFAQSYTGIYGACPNSVVIEMGNNSSNNIVESRVKICFEDLISGRLTDINQNLGNSFSSGCSNGFANSDMFIFAAAREGKCMLYKMSNHNPVLVSENSNLEPGMLLGFSEFNDRIYFDGNDGLNKQLWSTDGDTIWKETNLSLGIDSTSELIATENELALLTKDGLSILSQSDTFVSGVYSNISYANQTFIYNSENGIKIGSEIYSGEINSPAIYNDEQYWFMATTDSYGPQIHRLTNGLLQRLTDNIFNYEDWNFGLTWFDDKLIFANSSLYSFDIQNLVLTHLNSSITNPALHSNVIEYDEYLWFSCGVISFGYELCRSDGNEAWLFQDIATGMDSSYPNHLTLIDNQIIMIADDVTEGGQIYVVDSDSASLSFNPEPGLSTAGAHGSIWYHDSMAYFIADSNSYGLEMYAWPVWSLNEDWILI